MVHCLSAHRARALHPGFAVDLHGKSLTRGDGDATALSQPSAGMPKSRLHLTHMQAVLQTDHLYEIVPDVYGWSEYTLLNKTFYFACDVRIDTGHHNLYKIDCFTRILSHLE